MHPLVRTIASLKVTVVLLIMFAALLSFGTILESLRGAEAAREVYYSPFFFALQGVFALNVATALWERWPKTRWRIGFLITHTALLLILGGALTTALQGVEGQLPLWEGESSNRFFREGPGGRTIADDLPFTLRLDAFEMDLYPGTRRPAMFRSRVTVQHRTHGGRAAIIEMNRPLATEGFQFFQSSYRIEGGREMSVLSVSKDPGQPIVFLGYGLMVLGMLVVLATRILQRGGTAPTALVAMLLFGWGGAASAAESPPTALTAAYRRLPVQSDGRTMPLDTQARDAVRTVTGRSTWPGIDPAAMVVGWTIDPQGWMEKPIVRIDGEVASLVGLPADSRYASFRALVSSRPLRERLTMARHRADADHKPSREDKHLLKIDERLTVMNEFLVGEAIRPIPATDPVSAWSTAPDAASAAVYAELEGRIRPSAPSHYPSRATIEREIGYNAARPTRVAWLLLLPGAIAAGLSAGRGRRALRWTAIAGTGLGFLVMTWGIWTRWQIAGRIPASNMCESMLFLGWGVGLFGVVSIFLRNRIPLFNAAAMAALVMLLLDLLPIDPFIHPMPPVLSGTPWLAIHVPIIMVSYSVLAIGTFLAHVVVGIGVFSPKRHDLADRWSDLLYWYLMIGSILLIAGILTGSVWAASSWGRYWGWDPKEVWSLVAFLAYMAILHARFDGQIGNFGVAVSSIAAFWTILMTYLGVNFVLAAGLHSYGFGSSNLVRVMGVIALVEIAFLAAGWRSEKRRRATGSLGRLRLRT